MPRIMTLQELEALVAAMRAGNLDVSHLKVRYVLTIQKYDKTSVTEPGVEGLEPFETVEVTFENDQVVEARVIPGGLVAAGSAPGGS